MASKRKIVEISGGSDDIDVEEEEVNTVPSEDSKSADITDTVAVKTGGSAVRGVATSKRVWKPVQTKRFSADSRILNQPKKNSGVPFKVRQGLKAAKSAAKAIEVRLKAEKTGEREERKRKMEEKRKRKAENEFKTASYQVISDPTTMKRMNKKQLRQVKRMRVNEAGVPEFANAYS